MLHVKLLTAFAIALVNFLSLPCLAMEQEESGKAPSVPSMTLATPGKPSSTHSKEETDSLLPEKPSLKSTSSTKLEDVKEEKSCSCWGLSHWFSGIAEYLCCANGTPDGRYEKEGSRTDCLCDKCDPCGFDECSGCISCLCTPVCHLCYLPFACCELSQPDTYPKKITPFFRPNFQTAPPPRRRTDKEISDAYSVKMGDQPHIVSYKRLNRPDGIIYHDNITNPF